MDVHSFLNLIETGGNSDNADNEVYLTRKLAIILPLNHNKSCALRDRTVISHGITTHPILRSWQAFETEKHLLSLALF